MDTKELLKKKFEFTNNEIENKKIVDSLHNISEKEIDEKIAFLKTNFNLSDGDIKRIVKQLPTILRLQNDNINEKLESLTKKFNLTKEEADKMFRDQPSLMSFTPKTLDEKVDFYKSKFNVNDSEIDKLVRNFPTFLCFSENLVNQKVEAYENLFSLSNDEMETIFKAQPNILSINLSSLEEKQKVFSKLNLSHEYLTATPMIFTSPTKSLELKYKMFYSLSPSLKFLKYPWYLQSAEKSYARLNFLSSRENKVKTSVALISEKNFQKLYNVTSATLMEEYPLDDTAKEYIDASYKLARFEHENSFDSQKDMGIAQ